VAITLVLARQSWSMTVASPLLDRRLRAAARRLDRRDDSMAETWRRRAEVDELLRPVLADLIQGRVSAWDVARAIEAANLMRAPPVGERRS
jgi:hypothetical protein